jgi:hypothetical protein
MKRAEQLRRGLPNLRLLTASLEGQGAAVPNPFTPLAGMLESMRANRVTSVAHGDLNPRNVLLVGGDPCLIDYALTRDGDPIFMDFARLEGSLTRDVLPADLTWRQHVRLQRLLAWACYLGDDAAREFAARLGGERAELGRAFELSWAIRSAAREVYPRGHGEDWVRDYLEQLFLFAHLTLKWNDQTEAALRATAAMAGACAEALSLETCFRLWTDRDLNEDGLAVLDLMRRTKRYMPAAMASLSQRTEGSMGPKDDPLQAALDSARADYVREKFRGEATAIIHGLQNDHEVYISLRAFIGLRGRLTEGRARPRGSLSMDAVLEDDELFAERERLGTEDKLSDAIKLVATQRALVLLGDAGAGKSTVAREWEYLLAQEVAALGETAARLDPRLPVVIRASDAAARLHDWNPEQPESAAAVLKLDRHVLAIGAVHVTVDALNEVAEEQRRKVADWIVALRKTFPRSPVLVCHRQYNYVPGLLPFPVVVLQKVDEGQTRQYIYDYLRERGGKDHLQRAEKLIRLLLKSDDYKHVRDLAQTPLFLWMLVERYRATDSLPESRGPLFDDFSQWYLEDGYHKEHGEPVPLNHTYAEKAGLLGLLGHELVRLRETKLPEARLPSLAGDYPAWRSVSEEIIGAQMLQREDGNLRFLHQSFQEYFAARYFLEKVGSGSWSIRERVREYGWHDTLALLIGFGGDRPTVIRRIIEEALHVNPVLTARCLRMAETPDTVLLQQFVESRLQVLRDPRSGDYSRGVAANALAEFGAGPAQMALWSVAREIGAPESARIVCLERLTAMPGQPRFEGIAEKIRKEFVEGLTSIFNEPGAVRVREAAVEAVAKVRLAELGSYLSEFVQEAEWPLRRAARKACDRLGMQLTPRQRDAFLKACRERLDGVEAELFKEAVFARTYALNDERVEALRHLACAANLPLLLERRFSFGIHEEIAEIVDEVVASPQGDGELLAVLTEPEEAVERWLAMLRNADESMALAAAHRLCGLGEQLPVERISGLFDASLSPRRLSAAARIAAASGDESLAGPLDQFARSLIETVSGVDAMDAFSSLIEALRGLDESLGNRCGAVADMVFFTRRYEETLPGTFPWRKASGAIQVTEQDIISLIHSGGDGAEAAVSWLATWGGGYLRSAEPSRGDKLEPKASKQFQELARAAQSPFSIWRYAQAAAWVRFAELIPWLLEIAELETLKAEVRINDAQYGRLIEVIRATVMRALGYLARVSINDNHPAEAEAAASYLRGQYASRKQDDHRSIVVGLTTALGYLGEWEPILTNLGAGEPWMHVAAENVFKHWVAAEEIERAARWIVRRLREPELPQEVRSTLSKIKDQLEAKLGRHIVDDAAQAAAASAD